jgi:hypothetical protein
MTLNSETEIFICITILYYALVLIIKGCFLVSFVFMLYYNSIIIIINIIISSSSITIMLCV